LFQFQIPVKYFFVNSRPFNVNKYCKLKQLLLHLWLGIDQTIIKNRMTSSVGVGKGRTLRATIVTIFSRMTRDVSVFVKYDTILIFFCKLPQIRTSKFRKGGEATH